MPPPPHIKSPQEKPPNRPLKSPKRRFPILTILLFCVMIAAFNLPDHLNPLAPLDPNRTPNAITPLKVYRTSLNPDACFAALNAAEALSYSLLDDRDESEQCHIRMRTRVRAVAGSNLRPVETRCDIALRLYMWTRYEVQPAAQRHFGQSVEATDHFDSYSCRRMRTSSGTSTAMSAHATARAIDISGFRLSDGTVLSLKSSWNSTEATAFWRDVRAGACTWFRTVLSPDYNALHHDHFHLAQGRWMSCR